MIYQLLKDARTHVDPFMNTRVQDKALEWPTDGQSLYSREGVAHMDVGYMPHAETRAPNPDFQDSLRGRKRQWEHEPQLQSKFQIHNLRSNFLYSTFIRQWISL